MTRHHRILVTGAGSSMGFDVAHCLRGRFVIGADADPVGREFARRTCQRVRALPRAGDPMFIYAFDRLLDEEAPDAVFVCPEAEIVALAGHDRAGQLAAIPPAEAVAVAVDKFRTVEVCHRAASFPWTGRLDTDRSGCLPPWWLRSATGAGGRAAMLVRSERQLAAWLELNPDVTDWMLQAYLPGDNLNVTLLYWHGTLVAEAAARRDAYVLAKASPSGVTGDVADMTTVARPDAVAAARRAVAALPGEPHGFYSVDLKCDAVNRPHITEINPRLAARPRLYAAAGVNFPVLWLDVVRDGLPPKPSQTARVRIVRKLDMPPLMDTEADGTRLALADGH